MVASLRARGSQPRSQSKIRNAKAGTYSRYGYFAYAESLNSDEKNIIMRASDGLLPDALSNTIPWRIPGVKHAKAALSEVLRHRNVECFIVIHVTEHMEHLQFTFHEGNATSVIGPSKKIIADAVELGTKGLILAHNHPSGDPTPSESDLMFTRYLSQVCDQVDVTILDHLIFADGRWTSFREKGYL